MRPRVVDGTAGSALAGRVRTPSGRTLAAATARRIRESRPANTRRAHESRTNLFAAWCRDHGRIATDPGTVPDWAGYLADRQHPADTIAAYVGPVAASLALSGHPLDAEDRAYVEAVIRHRSTEEATDPDRSGDALQAAECSREDLAAMLATLDRSTVVGMRDAAALCLDWYMAGRASEPAALDVLDVRPCTVPLLDAATGELLDRDGLVVTVRRSKTNPYGRTRDTVRLLAQDGDPTCPVAAWRAWTEVLDGHGVTSGPLLRRVKHGRLTTAGRPPADARRAGGIGDRTIRNLIARCARAAGLVRPLTAEERALLSTRAGDKLLAAAESDAEREALRMDLRIRRRRLRQSLPRWSGHSMRRGRLRHWQRRGVPRHVAERQARYAPGSKAIARYWDDTVAWSEHPDMPAGLRAPSPAN
ncbi:site-specific integrase [Streptomyces sindenensis]|uniref:Integrase n=1 Tax=Streptomyces sindenensis TaxID=67363 RepID=A0ABW6ERU2_9ACTN